MTVSTFTLACSSIDATCCSYVCRVLSVPPAGLITTINFSLSLFRPPTLCTFRDGTYVSERIKHFRQFFFTLGFALTFIAFTVMKATKSSSSSSSSHRNTRYTSSRSIFWLTMMRTVGSTAVTIVTRSLLLSDHISSGIPPKLYLLLLPRETAVFIDGDQTTSSATTRALGCVQNPRQRNHEVLKT